MLFNPINFICFSSTQSTDSIAVKLVVSVQTLFMFIDEFYINRVHTTLRLFALIFPLAYTKASFLSALMKIGRIGVSAIFRIFLRVAKTRAHFTNSERTADICTLR